MSVSDIALSSVAADLPDEGVPDSLIGQTTDVLDTPVVIVDLDRFDANIARIVSRCREAGVAWRPHCKTHKSGAIAQRLVAAGAIGVTCAKLSEVAVMADAGVQDILLANQIAGPIKIARLMALRQRVDVAVCVDHPDNIAALGQAAAGAGVILRVLIEVDCGTRRAGVLPGDAAVALAREIGAYPHLRFVGVMTWEGHTTQIADPSEKRAAITAALTALTGTAHACRAAGFPVSIVSCGGTGTYDTSAFVDGVTEIQAGGGIFGDVRYRNTYRVSVDFALTIVATVTSRPTPRRIIADAGKKALSTDAGMPLAVGLPDGVTVTASGFSAEHAKLELGQDATLPRIGERIAFVPGYGDTTVHLHQALYGVRNGRIETVWPIRPDARLL
ncbi:DSD1 family PLP-dependent enzyme [Robbsia sp. KACC 23696]|uniref:DSD1 family PLP-dependent enzyme n=1 Tax=Robbsia sp. KACC 23696 TaxID=3149231 RepID=UPI00325B5E8C